MRREDSNHYFLLYRWPVMVESSFQKESKKQNPMARLPYVSPGVKVVETPTASLVPVLGTLSRICIVGTARGYEEAIERFLIEDAAMTFKNTGLDTGSIVVKSAVDGTTINAGNYTVAQLADPDTDIDGDETYTITRKGQPLTAPTLAAGTGTLVGTYYYAVTFVNAAGETGIGASTSASITLATQGANLSAIPLGTTGTTARKIYRKRTVATGGDDKFHLCATISDNVTTTLTGETASNGTVEAAAEPPVGINSGDTILAYYEYTNQWYYTPTPFDDYDDVVDKYGDAWDGDGLINSDLTFGARLAFSNGAGEVMCLALTADTTAAYTDALDTLELEETSTFVIPLTDNTSVHSLVASHVQTMNVRGLYRMCILGRDSTASSIPATTLRDAAAAYNNEAVILISPAAFRHLNPITGREELIGGHWVAAAVAGMFAARDPQIPLTRKTMAGFSGIEDKRTEGDRQHDSAAGLLAIEIKGGVMRVRHSLTTATGNVNTREASIVRAKYEMARRLRDSLDRNLIGVAVPLDEAPLLVNANVRAVLDLMKTEQIITSFSGIKSRPLKSDPTTIEVRFEYVPIYPINNIEVRFRINTEDGLFQFVEG